MTTESREQKADNPKLDNFNEWQAARLHFGEGLFLKDYEAWNSYHEWTMARRRKGQLYPQPRFAELLALQLEFRSRLTHPGHTGPAGWLGAEVVG